MISPAALSPDLFSEFFHALWGYGPFPWQQEFANCLCAGLPPDYVTVPTGSGKTACLDAAVFALAVQASRPVGERTAGRRVFFIVNRRIIVDEAFERAKTHLEPALTNPDKYLSEREAKKAVEQRLTPGELTIASAMLQRVADALLSLGGEKPLACAELHGGIYRDRAWAKSILQPMILCSTVDQAGSRLLFRGYGVSDEAKPIHAALVSQDSLLLIDEAHISQPFLQTLGWVKRYRLHRPEGTETVRLPFSVVCMTATPPKDEKATLLELNQKDLDHPILKRRLNATKPARLVPAPKAKGKNAIDELAKVLEAEASDIIAQQPPPKSIAIMVNRVATARQLERALTKKHDSAKMTLVIGRMRPLDRDQVTQELQSLLKTDTKPNPDARLQIVVSTQCLEVGADLDFDALVTECASLDALRQRFGRLNRDGRAITAQGVIVLPEEQRIEEGKLNEDKLADPIYGNAVPRTWRWLENLANDGTVDFGLNAMTEAVKASRDTPEKGELFARLLMPRADAPVLLPAYLDRWVQTNPLPAADPDVSLFLHGPQRDMAEVQVCWRADLPNKIDQWAETLALCPPTALECLPVPLQLMREWLRKGSSIEDTTGDAPASNETEEITKNSRGKDFAEKLKAVCWLDEKSYPIDSPSSLRPGLTIVLRAEDEGWKSLGHVPNADAKSIDVAEVGQETFRRRAVVRLHEKIWWPAGGEDSPSGQLKKWAKDTDFNWRSSEVKETLRVVADSLSEDPNRAARLRFLATDKKLDAEPYPDGSGMVLSSHSYLPPSLETQSDLADDGPGDPLLETPKKQSLAAHTAQVTKLAAGYAEALGLISFQNVISTAATMHDLGKADPRFQAMLIQSTISAAYAQPTLWAKSDSIPSSAKAREQGRKRAALPKRFRHEMLSAQLAAKANLPASEPRAALVLHLIASHHGHARPFAPVVFDDEPLAIQLDELGFTLTTEERIAAQAHALDSGIAERFWKLTRLHGWWGLVLLESVLRLADQTASASPESTPEP